MLLTKDEAKTKWCPFAPPINDFPGAANCIASECMAWRWGKGKRTEQRLKPGEQPEQDAKKKGWRTPTTTMGYVVWVRDIPSTRGYCGLATTPEDS